MARLRVAAQKNLLQHPKSLREEKAYEKNCYSVALAAIGRARRVGADHRRCSRREGVLGPRGAEPDSVQKLPWPAGPRRIRARPGGPRFERGAGSARRAQAL